MAEKINVASNQRPFVMTYWDFIKCDLLDWNEKRIFIILKNLLTPITNDCDTFPFVL